MPLRGFLLVACVGSSVFVALIGLAYYWEIHSLTYFLVIYCIQGCFQSMGWPAVAAIAGPWVSKGTRGFVLGVWNSSTFVGNIMGSAVAAAAVGVGSRYNVNWAMPFVLLAAVLLVCGFVVTALIVIRPSDAGFDFGDEGLEVRDPVDAEEPSPREVLCILSAAL